MPHRRRKIAQTQPILTVAPRLRRGSLLLPGLIALLIIAASFSSGADLSQWVTTSFSAADFECQSDTLWQMAVRIVARDSIWQPGLIRSYTTELDKTGGPKNVEMFWRLHQPGENGAIQMDIIKAIKNGKDITSEKQKRVQKQLREKDLTKGISEWALGLDGTSPFDPPLQERVKYRRVNSLEPPAGAPSVSFYFVREMEYTAPLKGIVWLHAKSGHPLEIRYAPDPPPGHVKEMEILMRYSLTPEGAWRPSELFIDAYGKFLFFSKRLHNSTIITDYWAGSTTSAP